MNFIRTSQLKNKKIANTGNGLYSSINKARNLTSGLLFKRQTLSPKVNSILEKVGDAVITDIKIGRTPVNALITGIIKVWSDTPYDRLFHLFVILNTTKGRVLLEKNEVINLSLKPNIKAEYLQLHNIPQNLTINELLANTEKQMGEHKFIHYSAYDNNCQDFIVNVLTSNGINEGLDFVKQDTESIFSTHPNLRKFANTVTDIANRANVAMMGGSIVHQYTLKKNNSTTNIQLYDILKKYGINTIIKGKSEFVKNDLNPNSSIICNLNDEKGTHWTSAFVDNKNNIFYFDSYGAYPPENLTKLKKFKHYYFSTSQIQKLNGTACGYYCTLFLLYMNKYKSLEGFQSFIDLFNVIDQVNNDKVLFRNLNIFELN